MTDTIDPRALHASRAKYAPHLDFRTKAAIFSLFHYRGVARKVLADAFAVHRLTVSHIIDDNPRHYADVKAKFREMGVLDFDAHYVVSDDITRVNRALNGMPAEAPPAAKSNDGPDPLANSCEGQHRLTARNAKGHIVVNRYIVIEWRSADTIRVPGKQPGWYWRVRDTMDWFDLDGRPGATSKELFDHVQALVIASAKTS